MMITDLMQNFGILGSNIHRKFMSNSKVLVLGANGMLGKMVSLHLSSSEDLIVDVTARSATDFIASNFKDNHHIFDASQNIESELEEIINGNHYKFIVNCICQ